MHMGISGWKAGRKALQQQEATLENGMSNFLNGGVVNCGEVSPKTDPMSILRQMEISPISIGISREAAEEEQDRTLPPTNIGKWVIAAGPSRSLSWVACNSYGPV